MKKITLFALPVSMMLIGIAHADDFKRERGKQNDDAKNAIEGKAAPALEVTGWMNTKTEEGLKLTDLIGKVVIIDFWGTW